MGEVDQYEGVVYPRRVDLGWIFYNDKNQSIYSARKEDPYIGYWEIVRRMGKDVLQNFYKNFCQNFTGERLKAELGRYSEALKHMSDIERSRENALMKEFTNEDLSTTTGREFIRHFNEIVIGQEQFSAILKGIIASMDKSEELRSKDPTKGKLRAPSQAVNFMSYFKSAINKLLEGANVDDLLDDEKLNNIIEQSLNIAIDNMTVNFDEGDGEFGTKVAYEGLDDYLKSNATFKEFVRSYLKIDDIKEEIKKIVTGTKRRRSGLKINDVYKVTEKDGKTKSNETFERMIGGYVQEFFSAGRMQISLGKKGGVVSGNSIRSNIGATDTLTVASKKVSLKVAKIIEEKIGNAMNGETQKQIAHKLKQTMNKLNKKKYSDVFVLHGSDKLYSVSDSFRGFNKTAKITDIQELIEMTGFSGDRIGHELVSLYLNTTPGAALSTDAKTKKIQDSLRIIIAAVAGQLLFSDWFMIGQEYGGPQQIHIFDLDGVIIPLSYVLDGMSKAMKTFGDTGIYQGPITIGSFETAPEILYPRKQIARYGIPAGEPMNDFNRFWLRQREDAREKAQFRITFMRDFKTIVRDIAETFKT